MGIDAPAASNASQSRQRRIGLTGGIASGKSSVARLLSEQYQLPVLDADVYAREALAPGTEAAHAVIKHFGTLVVEPDSNPSSAVVNRQALGKLVFRDSSQRQWLEHLVHPLVRSRLEQELLKLTSLPIVVLVIPLLFEAGFETWCTEIWLVDCTREQQIARLMKREGLSQAAVEERIDTQWPTESKRHLADVCINNTGNIKALSTEVESALWNR